MGARSGNNYLSTLKKLGAEIWFEGVRVPNVTSHEVLARRASAIASLYDLQMEKPEAMTFRTSDGGRAGMSFIQPRSAEEVRKRGRMMKIWADYSCGTMRDSPASANLQIAAMSAASAFFAENDRRHGDHIESYYREACNHDWCICLGLAGADVGAIEPGASGSSESLRIVERTPEGLITEGPCWAGSLLPACEELLVLPSRTVRTEGVAPFASAFAIPANTKGLKLLAKRSAARFAGPSCVAVFENVLIPWHRVFLLGDVDRARALPKATSANAHTSHQTAVRSLAMGEFIVGLAVLVAEAANVISDAAVRKRIGDMAATVEKMRAEVQLAEANAVAYRGVFAPAPGAFEQCVVQASRLQSQLAEVVRLASPSAAASVSLRDEAPGKELEAALEIARDSAGGSHETSTNDASLKPIVERVREFLARLD